jgi:hypothetical protein
LIANKIAPLPPDKQRAEAEGNLKWALQGDASRDPLRWRPKRKPGGVNLMLVEERRNVVDRERQLVGLRGVFAPPSPNVC